MRIKIINPDWGLTREQLVERENRLKKVARIDTEISMECPVSTHVYIDSELDVAVASPEIIKIAMKAESDGFDAVGIYCFSDPAIVACRETLSIPVIGGAQSSIYTACQLGNSFSIITTSKVRIAQKKAFINSMGIGNRLSSVVAVNNIESDNDRTKIKDELIRVTRECVERDGAEVIILGCLAWTGLAKEISEICGLPVVDPGFILIGFAELLISQGLSHSKISYPFPPKADRSWEKGSINIDNI